MRHGRSGYRSFACFVVIGILTIQVLSMGFLVSVTKAVSHDWYYKPSSYSQLVQWYLDLEAIYPGYLQVFKANELYGTGTVAGGYDLYYVRITNESSGFRKPEVFFSGGPHGNEKIGTIGLYWFTDWLMRYALHPESNNADREWLQWLLDNREVYICVCHNPWGFDHDSRYDANGWDLNREADHDGPGSPTGGLWASVNGKTLREFVNDHVLRVGTWFHDGTRAILYPWKYQHPSVAGTSPLSGRAYQRVPPDFYFYDAACLRLGNYVGDYGGDLDFGNIGNSYTLGYGGQGVIPHWAYGANVVRNPAEDGYVADETFGNYPGAGMLGLDPEVYSDGNPSQDRYGNDTINRFGAEIRRYALYLTDLAQPYLMWRSGTPENNSLVDQGPLAFKWQVSGCLAVDHTYIQWGTDPDPINNPEHATTDHDTYAGDYVGGTRWDNAESGQINGVTYSEGITIDRPGDYYFVAKAMVDQAYANVLAPGEYGSTPYLRLIKERTNATYYEELSGADGLEQINGQTWWYSPVMHLTVSENPALPNWWNPDWSYRKEITIDHTKVNETVSAFPVLIEVTDSDLASKAQTDAEDVAFTDGNGTKLSHEVEFYNGTDGHLVAWVNVPSLSSTVDTVLYMYYGNAGAANQENVTGTWDSNFMMVQHLSETSGTHYDSTANDNDGTVTGATQDAVGKIDGADGFDGSGDYVSVPHSNTLTDFTSAMTASAWVKIENTSAWQAILNKYDTAGDQRSWYLDYRGASSPKAFGMSASANGIAINTWTASYTPSAGTWYYVAVVWQSNQIPKFYVSGQQVTTSGSGLTASIYNNTATPLYVGRAWSVATPAWRYFNGTIDEARISNTARSASWIATSYNNQLDPSSFCTLKSEETLPESPIISNPWPSDGATDVSVELTELSFRLTDLQEDPMNYTITTFPNIGSGNGTNVPNESYIVDVSGLARDTTYTWHVNVTDGTNNSYRNFTFTTETGPPQWWNSDWSFRKTVTIDHAKVSGSLSGFPVLIDVADGDLAGKAQSDADDIVFTDYSGAKLNHEIELYNGTSGRLVAWVNVPSLSSTVDTVLYMYYGNAGAANQENVTGTWDSNFMMVQHLSETSGTHFDSTANDNDGTASGAVQGVLGKIDGADDFDGANDYVEVAHSNTLSGFTEAMTVCVWVKLDENITRQTILNKYNTTNNQRGWALDYTINQPSAGQNAFGLIASSDGGTQWESWFAPYNPTQSAWIHLAVVWTPDQTSLPFYVNGVQISGAGTQNKTVSSIFNNTLEPLYFGRAYSAASPERYLGGIIDEVRVSNVARSAGWIITSYNNQHDPSSFYDLGDEETPLPTTMGVEPITTYANLDSECVVHIVITEISDLYAMEFQLNYNTSILDLTSASVVAGGLNEPKYLYYNLTDEVNGHLWFAASTTYPTTAGISYAEHAIVELRLHTVESGTSNLDLHSTHLSDSQINPITHTVINGAVIVGDHGEIDLEVIDIRILNHGCSIYANDTFSNGSAYFYPVETTILNNGALPAEAFYVKLDVYWVNGSINEVSAEMFVPSLSAGMNATINFTDVFCPLHTGWYRLTVTVDSHDDVSESNEGNNSLIYDNTEVTVIGDINGDQRVNVLDAVIIAQAWNAYTTSPQWNVRADINHDGHVDVLDGTRIGLHWGRTA